MQRTFRVRDAGIRGARLCRRRPRLHADVLRRYACSGMTIHAPPAPQMLTVKCTGEDRFTCGSMKIYAEHSAGLRFTCETTEEGCGYDTMIFCPGCDQNAEGCATGSGFIEGGGQCEVNCVAAAQREGVCDRMKVYSGAHGTSVNCTGDESTPNTCRQVQLHAPAVYTAAAMVAPLSFECAACTGDRCCNSAEIIPGTS